MKKKMKKMFSKITTLVLLVAMLIPYTSIPKVEAATDSCENGEWEYHTNYYFFLQAETPFSWAEMFKGEAQSVTTAYYTGFLYNFPKDGSKIEFQDDGFVRITKGTSVNSNFNPGTERTQWTAAQFYKELQSENLSSEFSGNLKEYAFKAYGNGTSENDRIVSYLFHGDWAHVDTVSGKRPNSSKNENINWDLNNLDVRSGGLDTSSTGLSNLANASILITNVDKNATISQAEIGSGSLNQGNLTIDISQIKQAIINYNNGVGENTTVQKYPTSTEPVVNMIIKRTYNFNDIFTSAVKSITTADDSTSGTNGSDGKIMGKNTSDAEVELALPRDKNQKIMINTNDNASIQETVHLKDTYANNNGTYWFLAPTLYQISYKVCKASNEATEDSVTLTYKGNEPKGTASNIPDIQTEKLNSEGKATVVVSSKTPELDGYKFKNWNTSANCDGTSIEPEAKLTLTDHKTLYACWGKTGTTNNGKTGVATYAGLFTGIIALAGGSYYLIKKKNLFKKI